MPTQLERIPFAPYEELSSEELAGAGREAFNVVIDGRGAIQRRPGIVAYGSGEVIDAAGITSIYATSIGKLFAVGGGPGLRRIYVVTEAGQSQLTEPLQGGKKATWAETQAIVAVAGGRDILKIDQQSYAVERLGGNPPWTTHIIAQSSRLLGIEVRNSESLNAVNFSAPQTGNSVAGHEIWNGVSSALGTSGLFSAAARPDANVALHEDTNEVFVFGKSNVQVFAPDPQFVYSPVTTREFGLGAPYSVIKDDQAFAWLDDNRRFVQSDGREFTVISQQIKHALDSMATVDDCHGYRVIVGAVDALVWTFPTDGRTFVFQRGGGWSQWAGWDETVANWKPFEVECLTRIVGTAKHVVGLTTGRLGLLNRASLTDLGEPINARITTGFIDHGSSSRKQCVAVKLALRRGQASPGEEPVGFLEWRDNLGDWTGRVEVDFGSLHDREVVVQFRSLGVYRSRQWRFTFTHTTQELSLASATEEFEVLDA